MEKIEFQAKMMFYIMLKSLEEIAKVDEELQEEFEDFEAKIQWKIANFKGYQIFEGGQYSFVIDGEIENPDLTMIIENAETAKAFFSGDIDGTTAFMSGDLKIEGDLQLALGFGSLADFITEYLEPIRPS
ncbi:MAG: SCP2 sterol-binding domain-containing protein [Promethearchaeota archaeon]